MIFTTFLTIVYLFIAAFILKSFVHKEDNFYVSLNMFYGFALVFLTFLINAIMLFYDITNYSLSTSIVSINITGLFLIFNASTRIRSIITDSPNITRRKILNTLFLTAMSATIFFFSYITTDVVHTTISPILFESNLLNVYYMSTVILLLLLITFHIPGFKEYFYIRIGTLVHVFSLIIYIADLYVPYDLSLTSRTVSVLSLVIWFFAFKKLYDIKKPPFS